MAKLVLVARDTWDGLLFSFFSGEVITLNILRGVVMVALASEIVFATEKDVRSVRGSDDDDSLCLLSLLDFTFFIALSLKIGAIVVAMVVLFEQRRCTFVVDESVVGRFFLQDGDVIGGGR